MLRKYYYFTFIIIFLFIFGTQKLGYKLPYYIHNYGSNFICMPIILKTIQLTLKFVSKKNIRLSYIHIISVTLYFSWYFEYYIPKHNTRYTADYFDIMLYFIGSLLYCYLESNFKDTREYN
jgi:hypothetical protein